MTRGNSVASLFGTSCRKLVFPVSIAMSLAACTIIEGGTTSEATKVEPAEIAAAAEAVAAADEALTTASIASANFPLPMPSPRPRNPVQVASIDPSAGVSALSSAPSVHQLTGVYADYGSAVASVDENRLRTPSDVRRAMAALRFKEPDALADGWYVSHAMIAAQDPVFAQGVRSEARKLGKKTFLTLLKADDDYVLQISGMSSASAAVAVAIRNQNERMAALSARFIDTAYQFQKQKWGMTTPLPGTQEPETKAASLGVVDRARAVLAAMSPVGTAHAYAPSVMNRILTLAAHHVVDGSMETAQANQPRNPTGRCLNWARLNLDQCIAAARFPSEEAWCTGKHAVEEVRGCFADALPPMATSTN
ncbi:hypothetical protein Plav_0879 [Parvibaculum lavamentivorans DS-1]|uniref:Uncharacterized protein n=1 Tax=Parvibaculum lavamentivorans (strain DS-1 / DSM 13023 / NCIMB 13966) TaxID=402881 RepID=A7HRG9_PARL1|nr:hypothetical protein [Parvibaculum lavamentivorans]ABS62502.1 hypothetical protein Plav_0879 [Parvibaculum lavamentivorans DS-1]